MGMGFWGIKDFQREHKQEECNADELMKLNKYIVNHQIKDTFAEKWKLQWLK